MRRLLTLALATSLFAALAIPASAARPDFAKRSEATVVETAIALSGGANAGTFDTNPGDFDILINALIATGAIDLFDGSQNWTVFAPTDQAFLDLASAFAGEAVTDEAEAFGVIVDTVGAGGVTAVLQYHLTDGVRNSQTVLNAKQITMADGNTITARGGFVDANRSDADFVQIDVRAADGMIHVIDTVLLP